MAPRRSNSIFLVVAFTAFLAIAGYGTLLGPGEDRDSYLVLRNAPLVAQGHYEPSRSWGYPLYEIPVSHLVAAWGPAAANVYSLALGMASLALAWRLVRGSRHARLLFTALAFHPLMLINSSVPMDFVQGLALMLAALYAADLHARHGRPLHFLLTLALFLLAILTRPDYLLAACAAFLAQALTGPARPARLAGLALAWAGVAAAGLLGYAWINGGLHFLHSDLLFLDPPTHKALLFLGGLAVAAGPLAAPVWALLFLAHARGIAGLVRAPANHDRLVLTFACMALLFLPRFFMVPNDADYLLPLLAAGLVAMSRAAPRPGLAAALCVLTVAANLVTVSIVDRPPFQDRLTFSPGLDKGALLQDYASRRFNLVTNGGPFRDYLSDSLGRVAALPPDAAVERRPFDIGYRCADRFFVTDTGQAYKLATGRMPRVAQAVAGLEVFVSDSVLVGIRGWRVLQAPPDYARTLEEFHAGRPLALRPWTERAIGD